MTILGKSVRLLTLALVLTLVTGANPTFAASFGGSNLTNVAIPDAPAGPVYSIITISGAPADAVVGGVDVSLNGQHTFSQDLDIALVRDQTGVGPFEIVFDGLAQGATEPGSFSSSRTGIQALNGTPVNGQWLLEIQDFQQIDTGFLDGWTITVRTEDRRVESATVTPSIVTEGESFTVTARVGNAGTLQASGPLDVLFYDSLNPVILPDADDLLLDFVPVGSLFPGLTEDLLLPLPGLGGPDPTTFWIGACLGFPTTGTITGCTGAAPLVYAAPGFESRLSEQSAPLGITGTSLLRSTVVLPDFAPELRVERVDFAMVGSHSSPADLELFLGRDPDGLAGAVQVWPGGPTDGQRIYDGLFAITAFGGDIPAGEWYLWARNQDAGSSGTIEKWWLTVHAGSFDRDGDGVPDDEDAFPDDPSESVDTDSDGIGDNTDPDDDGDGVEDGADAFPLDPFESVDTDGDGIGNNTDTDDDGDGVPDTEDDLPLDAGESVDTDGDGIGNNTDTDDDGDGLSDEQEDTAGLDPLDPADAAADPDNDGFSSAEEVAAATDPFDPLSLPGGAPVQRVFSDPALVLGVPGQTIGVPLRYDVSNRDASLSGLGLRVHFDSSSLSFGGLDEVLTTGLVGFDQFAQDDIGDLDGDPATDSFVSLAWADVGGSWPGTVPAELAVARFTLSGLAGGVASTVRFTASSTAATHGFRGAPVVVLAGSPLDIDGDGQVTALTDGILLLRHLFGFTGETLVAGVVASGCSRCDSTSIQNHLDGLPLADLDVDGDGAAAALTDGLLVLRYAFGFRGETLVAGVVAGGCSRCAAGEVEGHLQGRTEGAVVPNVPPTPQFTMTPPSGIVPLSVTFDATGSTDADGEITAFSWRFGDGTIGSGASVQHLFATPGDYLVTLTVTDDLGASTSTSRTLSALPEQTFSVEGSVSLIDGSLADSDVNDPNTPLIRNDGFVAAQSVPNPISIGGYAGVAGAGASGQLRGIGDESDFFQLDAVGGENILLTIGDAVAGDLDIYLYDDQQQLVDASFGIIDTESLVIPGPGQYYVEVYAFSGASNYVLIIGQELTAVARAPRLSDPLIAGEMIVGASVVSGRSASRPADELLSRLERRSPASAPSRAPSLMKLDASRLSRDTRDQLKIGRVAAGATVGASARARLETLGAVKALQQTGHYRSVAPNFMLQTTQVPNDPLFPNQWHYPAIDLPQAWDVTTGSPDVIVAVVDTGVLLSHPDLDAQLVPGFDFISSTERSQDGDGIDPNPDDNGDGEIAGNNSYHGTHVAGTVAAETNNGEGVAGVAWGARIMPIRVLGRGGGSSFDVLQGMLFAAGLPNVSGTVPAVPADVINLSLGGGGFSQVEQDAIADIRAAGTIIVAAAGNESAPEVSFPALYDGVVAVSATNISNAIAFYSNTGSGVDVAAPGGESSRDLNGDGVPDGVMSTLGDASSGSTRFIYQQYQGTSMATPHVAGVVALMRSVHPALTPAEFDAMLSAGLLTDDLGPTGRDDGYGHGLINAQKAISAAVSAAGGEILIDPSISVTPGSLNFGSIIDALEVAVRVNLPGEIEIVSVTSDVPWLSAVPLAVDARGVGTYDIRVDRTQLTGNIGRGSISFVSSNNSVSVSAIARPAAGDFEPDAGLHYVILVDEDGNTVAQDEVFAVGGQYPYQFTDIAPGRYEVVAGSDYDNDFFLCDAGESCGIYPTFDRAEQILVDRDLTDVDFFTGFRITLTTSSSDATDRRAPGRSRLAPDSGEQAP